MDLVVRTEYGAVRGAADGEVSVFKGIPYAAPLDGPRRFQAPVAPQRWEGVRDASAFSASVPQPAMGLGLPSLWQPGDSTDCLSVNVWTPDRGGGLPVMVWIHGGAFMAGGSDSPAYDGSLLASSGVVVVTVNYRVGYEGFGWVSDAPANRGILDQLAALRWVRDNITSFGGDPDNVTIFGESAGGTSVGVLVGGSARAGLFRRGIAQSIGSLFCDEDEARKIGDLITGQLGAPTTAEGLGALPPEVFHGAQVSAMVEIGQNRSAWTNSTPYGVVLDGDVLADLPWVALRSGAGRGVDLISGFNTDEGKLFTADLPAEQRDPAEMARGLRLEPSVLDEYRTRYSGISDADLHTLLLTDQLFRIPAAWCAEGHAEAGGRSYLYEFAWPSPARDGALGACHGLDVPFTFGVAESELTQPMFGAEVPPDFAVLSAELRKAWTSFAATGDPGWPAYTAAERRTRVWNVPATVVADTIKPSREIWQRYLPA
ncbi:carboxylesterase family protein [Saccharopolyspora sp. K220]|uniref:carboxylesterase/lipase family protein n=1 Tax=Saccharopolyspora soli TaxID=2926618 RepID=UPI001F58EA2D|nr:carboxylesterase family protein [Saccharopolyspora soli]MCI2417585.1 carboxylesterase family protein [Saccharopolyspora soli]